VGVVNLAVLACVLRARIKKRSKGHQLFFTEKSVPPEKILATPVNIV